MKLVCLACGQGNRVPDDRAAEAAKCGTCGEALVRNRPVDISFDVLQRAIRMDQMPLAVDFWAAWCGPCRMMAPEFAKAAATLHGKARFAKLDTEAFPEAGQRFDIRGIPLVLVFDRGREVRRQAGALPAARLAELVGDAARA